MRVYSDHLRSTDLRRATGVLRYVHCDVVRTWKARKHRYGYQCYLSYDGPEKRLWSARIDERCKAATWDEHGIWMQMLFDRDPHARIGPYNGLADFHVQTEAEMQRYRRYYEDRTPKRTQVKTAPWLAHPEHWYMRMRKRAVNHLYRTITTRTVPFDSWMAEIILECFRREGQRASHFLPVVELDECVGLGPVTDRRKVVVRKVLAGNIETFPWETLERLSKGERP